MFSFDFDSMKPFQEEWQFAHEGIDNGALDDNKHLLIPQISCPSIISSNYWAISNVDRGNHSQYLKSVECEVSSSLEEYDIDLISPNHDNKGNELKEHEEKEENLKYSRSSSAPMPLLPNISEISTQYDDNLIKVIHDIVWEKYKSYEEEEISLESLKELENKNCHK